jgi:hypothetical protein
MKEVNKLLEDKIREYEEIITRFQDKCNNLENSLYNVIK